jgi:hypothetical protein
VLAVVAQLDDPNALRPELREWAPEARVLLTRADETVVRRSRTLREMLEAARTRVVKRLGMAAWLVESR